MSTKDWIEKDYYAVLGVSKNAKPDEIKKAFRKIARENHPDQHPGDKKAEARFKEASEAHSVLSDPKQRKEYDEARSLFGGGGFRMPSGGNSGSFSTIFSGGAPDADLGDLLGGLFGGGVGRRSSSRGPRRGRDIEAETTISFVESVEGASLTIQLPSEAACPTCQGTGAKPGTSPRLCQTCQGAGTVTSTQAGGVFAMSEPCPDCHGRGLLIDDPCLDCHGTGRAVHGRPLTLRVPAGVADGQRIRVKGKGAAGERGGPAGDLYVVVHVRPHEIFGRQGDALTVELPIDIPTAVLGGQVEVPTLDGGTVRMKVPELTPPGKTMRLRGKGIVGKDGTRGDLLVTLSMQVPTHLDDDAREAMQAFADALRKNPTQD